MATRTLSMTDGLHAYLVANTLQETEAQTRLRDETALLSNSGMQISPEQGQFMTFLIKTLGVKKALEVGVFTGYSSLSVAQALPDDGQLIACDVSEEFTSVARRYWQDAGVAAKIELRLAPAVETLEKLLAEGHTGTFDFAFIDADKPNYDAYYEAALQLVRAGGVIGIDNTLWAGRVADPENTDESTEVIRALTAKIHGDARVDSCLLPIGDGLTLVRKR